MLYALQYIHYISCIIHSIVWFTLYTITYIIYRNLYKRNKGQEVVADFFIRPRLAHPVPGLSLMSVHPPAAAERSPASFWYNVSVLVKMDFEELQQVDPRLLNHMRLLHSMVGEEDSVPVGCPG